MVNSRLDRVYIDTNVLVLNWFYHNSNKNSKSNEREANDAISYLRSIKGLKLYTSTLSVAQFYSIISKYIKPSSVNYTHSQLRNDLKEIQLKFRLIPFTEKNVEEACRDKNEDIEDGFQYSISQQVNAFYIVTDNVKHFKNSNYLNISAIKPKDVRKYISNGKFKRK